MQFNLLYIFLWASDVRCVLCISQARLSYAAVTNNPQNLSDLKQQRFVSCSCSMFQHMESAGGLCSLRDSG